MTDLDVWAIVGISSALVQFLGWRNRIALRSWVAAPVVDSLKRRVWIWCNLAGFLSTVHLAGACLVACHQFGWLRVRLPWLYAPLSSKVEVSDLICLGLIPAAVAVVP